MNLGKLNTMSAAPPLQALRTFVEVGQRGSIKAAAEALHVTPGTIRQPEISAAA
ncbi:TPA: helix-turn-helix domain-containing protein [Burkholderia lata]